MIVLDASVLIGHLEVADALHERASTLLAELAGDAFGASPMTLAEMLVGPARRGALDTAETVLRHLGVVAVPFAADGARQLAVIRADTGLKLRDCCVVLAAEQVGAPIATFDQRLAAAARRRGLTVVDGDSGSS